MLGALLGHVLGSFSVDCGAAQMFLSGEAGYPIERTLLTSGIVEAACHSLTYGKRIQTPQMASLTYQPYSSASLFGGHQEVYHARRED